MDWGSAIVAGVAATAVMTAVMYLGKAMGMPMDMPRMLGLMVGEPDDSGAVYGVGGVVHVMMGVVFGVGYAAFFEALNVDPSWGWGALVGVAHGMVAGMAFGMMPALHPRMGVGKVLAAPGLFGVNYGAMVPAGVIMLHVIFGAVVGGVYGGA